MSYVAKYRGTVYHWHKKHGAFTVIMKDSVGNELIRFDVTEVAGGEIVPKFYINGGGVKWNNTISQYISGVREVSKGLSKIKKHCIAAMKSGDVNGQFTL